MIVHVEQFQPLYVAQVVLPPLDVSRARPLPPPAHHAQHAHDTLPRYNTTFSDGSCTRRWLDFCRVLAGVFKAA
jgi:hypothetical protein